MSNYIYYSIYTLHGVPFYLFFLPCSDISCSQTVCICNSMYSRRYPSYRPIAILVSDCLFFSCIVMSESAEELQSIIDAVDEYGSDFRVRFSSVKKKNKIMLLFKATRIPGCIL